MVIFVCAWYFKMLIPMLIWCVMFLMLRNYIGGLLLINIFTEPVIHDENLKGYISRWSSLCGIFKPWQYKIRECCFYGDNFCRVFIWNGFVNKSEKR